MYFINTFVILYLINKKCELSSLGNWYQPIQGQTILVDYLLVVGQVLKMKTGFRGFETE